MIDRVTVPLPDGSMASPDDQSRPPDGSLLREIASGDDRALAGLYDRHAATVYGLALGILRDPAEAEEVVADTFIQVWRTAATFDRARGTVAAWIVMVARSRALDRLRSRRRRGDVVERAATTDPGHSPGHGVHQAPADRRVERSEKRGIIERALEELPGPQREVIELAFFRGLSQTEISAAIDVPLGTVKTRIRMGMQKLRESLGPILSEAGP